MRTFIIVLGLLLSTTAQAADELRCLALNVYHEARNQSTEGKEAIAHVTINRREADNYPNTICANVYLNKRPGTRRCQFSWTCDRKSDLPTDIKEWVEAQNVAKYVYKFRTYLGVDPTMGALWYHADYVKPIWRKKLTRLKKIDDHIFYVK